jgi:hypothetical protein
VTSHTFHVDKLNVGGTLSTLLDSYLTETPLIIDTPRPPPDFMEIDPALDFSFLGYDRDERIKSSQLWERLSFLLSMGGFITFPNSIETLRYEHNTIKVVTQNMRRIDVTYNKLRRLDNKFTGFTWIYDWFAVRSGGNHTIDYLEDKDGYLANKLVFYPSKRIGVVDKRDVVAVSLAKSEQVFDMEYSEGYASLKTRNMMSEAGIRGTSKGYGYQGRRRHEPIKIEHIHREYHEQLIPDATLGQLLALPRKQGVLCRLTKSLFRAKMPST